MDQIVDMLNRIRNAQVVSHQTVEVPYSNIKYAILEVFKRYGYVDKIEKVGRKNRKYIKIDLKYDAGAGVIADMRRVSKQGQRTYSAYKELRLVKGGGGIAVLSTPKGIMSNLEARKQKVGGEILVQIW